MKKYYVILNVLGLFFILVAGIWAGMLWQNSHMIKESAYEEKHGTNIAVVNQDLGIPIDDQTINYANAVIETLGSDYTVVSLSAAETGLDNGTYGAVVQNNPRQAVLDLAVSKRLPEDSYISLYTKLLSMEQQVNNNMAYAYVESVFGELHSAQDDVKKLLANDETDMSAVEKVRMAKYIEMLDLGDIPKVEFNPVSPDFEALLTKVQIIADDMNQVYVDSYAVAQADYADVQKQISNYEKTISSQSASWITAMNTWSDGVSSYKDELEEWRTAANDSIIETRTDMSTACDSIDKASGTFLNSFNSEIDKLKEWAIYIEECQTRIEEGEQLPLKPQCDMPKKIEEDVKVDFINSVVVICNELSEKLEEIKDVPPMPSDISLENVPKQPTELSKALDGIVKVSTGYNPDAYFDDKTKEKAQQNVSKYEAHLDSEKSEMESKNSSNLGQLNSAYQTYNKHVGDLRMKITEVHTKEQENLQKSITGLSDTLKKTSKDNHGLMDSFVGRMPNSRNESTVNQEVVEATVTPIGYSYDYIRVGEKPKQSDAVPWLLPILIVLLLSIVLVALIIWIQNRKQGKELE